MIASMFILVEVNDTEMDIVAIEDSKNSKVKPWTVVNDLVTIPLEVHVTLNSAKPKLGH